MLIVEVRQPMISFFYMVFYTYQIFNSKLALLLQFFKKAIMKAIF